MKSHFFINRILLSLLLFPSLVFSQNNQPFDVSQYNIVWNSPSKNSSESMPCGGGDIGTNVWVEKGAVFLYFSRSGTFDENGIMPKLGRMRLQLLPNPFSNGVFKQELHLDKGYVTIYGKSKNAEAMVKVWVDVFHPVLHIEVDSKQTVHATATYENWRTTDYEWTNKLEFNASRAFINAPAKPIIRKDSIGFENNNVLFYHRNRKETLFDFTVKQQGLDSIKNQLWNPLSRLTFGGCMYANNMMPKALVNGTYAITNFSGWQLQSVNKAKQFHVKIALHRNQAVSDEAFKNELLDIIQKVENTKGSAEASMAWWKAYWNRSHIAINTIKVDTASKAWQIGRNYNVFRYQLGCNAYGNYPTKFNGGLFTFDPYYVDSNYHATPDHRDWGGVTFTAQNQRLLYWPMLKSGDFDMMAPQLDFYLNALKNAELRTKVYWGHNGASFTEQIELFGLPVAFEYGWNRPKGYPEGVEYNKWLEYVWDTALEFCLIAMDKQQFNGDDITKYIPLIESCLTFFYEHYQKESLKRTLQPFDGNGKLVLFPGSGAETYKVAYNASSTVAGLQVVLNRFTQLPTNYLDNGKRNFWKTVLKRIPAIPTMQKDGHTVIAPAQVWDRRQNHELSQLYPVYPWGVYGIGKQNIQLAIDTWKYGAEVPAQKDFISWHQDAITCARLGLTEEAAEIETKKMQNAQRRFPTFWGPGHDWVPDHNWGGSGMIGLQEMLLQTDSTHIYLFPAWPKNWDVSFKLHAPFNTTVEGKLVNGKLEELIVVPVSRKKDVQLMIKL